MGDMADYFLEQQEADDCFYFPRGGYSVERHFQPNPNYYHTRLEATKVRETENAYLLSFDGREIWIPKKICRDVNFGFGKGSLFIHSETLRAILERHQEYVDEEREARF